ncbi:MAG: hypothetical protein KA783_11265 [Chitinophagales bacterium]|nr:hypothetical protein [Chitinophagales bacterium]
MSPLRGLNALFKPNVSMLTVLTQLLKHQTSLKTYLLFGQIQTSPAKTIQVSLLPMLI